MPQLIRILLPAESDTLRSGLNCFFSRTCARLEDDECDLEYKWVFKRKPLSDGGVRSKARLVIRGFLQRYGVDFMETYAPTASLAAFRLLVAVAVFNGWSIRILDIITAFLYGDIDSEVYRGFQMVVTGGNKKEILLVLRY
jgi:hypothetical protein